MQPGNSICNVILFIFCTLLLLQFIWCPAQGPQFITNCGDFNHLDKKNLLYFWPCLDTRCVDSFDVERTYPYLTFLQSHSLHFNVRKSIHQELPCTSEVFLMGPSSTKETLDINKIKPIKNCNTKLLYNYMYREVFYLKLS